jgi:hypothetical protein
LKTIFCGYNVVINEYLCFWLVNERVEFVSGTPASQFWEESS